MPEPSVKEGKEGPGRQHTSPSFTGEAGRSTGILSQHRESQTYLLVTDANLERTQRKKVKNSMGHFLSGGVGVEGTKNHNYYVLGILCCLF